MRGVVLILFVVLILVLCWFALGSRSPARVRRRVVERPAPRRVVRRRATYVEEPTEIIEQAPPIVEERRTLE